MAEFSNCRSQFLIVFVFASTFALTAELARAQSPSGQDIDRAQLLRSQARLREDPYSAEDDVDNGQAAASPNDPDLGVQEILKRVERYQPFTVSIAAPFYYTSNVALVRRGARSDILAAAGASLTYAPRFTRTLFGNFTVQRQLFTYDRFGQLDFGTFDFRAGLILYIPKLNNLVLRVEYDFSRLTLSHGFDDLFSSHSIFLGAEMPFKIGRVQQFSLGTDANLSFAADAAAPRRNEFDVYAGYAVSLTRALSLDAVGRIFVRDYYFGGRTDVSEVLALSANYQVTKCFNASVVSTVAWSQSNQSVFDYTVANIGGVLALTWRF